MRFLCDPEKPAAFILAKLHMEMLSLDANSRFIAVHRSASASSTGRSAVKQSRGGEARPLLEWISQVDPSPVVRQVARARLAATPGR